MTLLEMPLPVFLAWWGLVGLLVGSFLNVAIHRHSIEGESISKPRRSRCPSCKTTLTWRENIPLFSWLVQRGRCRTCGWRIPLRYPLVEALNAGAWVWIASRAFPEQWAVGLVQCVVVSALIVATFVDFDCFEIPDEVSIGGLVAAPILSFVLPELHRGGVLVAWLDGTSQLDPSRRAALTSALAGMAVGAGILWLIGWVGSRIYGRDAMGLGDVKLLGAGGGFVGPGAVLVALMIGALAASVFGLVNILRYAFLVRARNRRRGRRRGFGHAFATGRVAGRYLPFGPFLALGIAVVLLAWPQIEPYLHFVPR
ncbi:MAG: prepilin peptidase [Planctomycetes bacterium]|nr:prepilin peptidase [Planctomycetota bacterium]